MASLEEGKDVQLLRAVCNSTFEKIAKCVSEERFIELFSYLSASKSKSKSRIQKLYKVYQSTLTEDLKERVDTLIEEEELDKQFRKRAELLENQKEFEGTTAWRPSGDPTKDTRSHDMQTLIEMKSAMEEYLQQKEPYIEELSRKVRQDAKDAAALHVSIHSLSAKVAEKTAVLEELEETHSKIVKALIPLSLDSQET